MIVNDRITVADVAEASARIAAARIDVTPIVTAWRGMEKLIRVAVRAYAEQMRRVRLLFAPLIRAAARAQAIEAHGRWNVAGDGTWQTDLCAAWLHGSCPAPGHCDCTCHGGSVQ